jgi:DNA-binding MarR family transcriptional regulator
MTPGQLARETGLSTGATTALLDRLERGGFVRSKRDLSDRRRVLVQPTKRPIDEVRPIFEELVAGGGRTYGAVRLQEIETILRFLERQRAVVREHLLAGIRTWGQGRQRKS